MSSLSIRREMRDGVEFFTVEETGESGLSHTGLEIPDGTRQTMSVYARKLNSLSAHQQGRLSNGDRVHRPERKQ